MTEEAKTDTVSDILNMRGSNYGRFIDHATLAQVLKDTARSSSSWERMMPDQKEAIDMVMHKIARILNGNPDYVDSWVDIEGYVRLVRERLEGGKPR